MNVTVTAREEEGVSHLIQELEALDFISDIGQATGVKVAIGVNAYIEKPDQISSYMVLIDPSSCARVCRLSETYLSSLSGECKREHASARNPPLPRDPT